jgi:RNA-binding protein YhbY
MIHSHVQLGKNGITENFIETLKDHFKNHVNVKISVLKSAGHNKEGIKKYSEEILEKLGRNYTARVLGFTIFLKKWKKNVR